MGRALELPGENPTLKAHPRMTFRRGTYSYTVETVGDKSSYTVTDGANAPPRSPYRFFGVSERARRHGFSSFEPVSMSSRVTFYAALDGLDITMGENQVTPSTLEEAMGRRLARAEG